LSPANLLPRSGGTVAQCLVPPRQGEPRFEAAFGPVAQFQPAAVILGDAPRAGAAVTPEVVIHVVLGSLFAFFLWKARGA
jgi:hypothetical protein